MVAGKSLTSWPSLQTDISNAGGDWHDQPALVCSAMGFDLVTSRKRDDLDAFNDELVQDVRAGGVRDGRVSAASRG